ncbi:MAG: hypothetical protein Q8K32_24710 [Archangium sp.]|nr:hypothetical protein [Archangium sp.]
MKKLFRIVIGALIALLALYYGGVNAVLASSYGEKLLNVDPALFQIRYDRAWTLIPGEIEVRGFKLSTQDHLVQFMVTADRVHGDLHLLTLANLHFHATDIEADGVIVHIRPRVEAGSELEKYLGDLPLIEGYESAMITKEEKARPLGPLLLLDFERLTIHHLREVWIERQRYNGDAELTGSMLYKPFSRLALRDVRFSDANARLAVEPHLIPIERIGLHVDLEEIDLAHTTFDSLRSLTAQLQLSATVEPRFLNGYLTNVKGLSTLRASGVEGPLEVDVKIEEGVISDDSKLSFSTPRVAMRLPYVEISGAAAVKARADKGRVALSVEVSKAALQQRDGERLAEADRFAVLATSGVDLTRMDSVDAQLILSGGRVKELRDLNQFIPGGAGLRIAEGQGEIEGTISLDAESARGRGNIDVTASSVSVKNRSAVITGKLQVHGEIRSLNLDTGAIDLSGSSLAIEEATLKADGKTSPLWVKAVAEQAVFTPKGKTQWTTKFGVGASNLQPLLAIVSANLPLPRAINLLTNSPNVKATAEMIVKEDSIELPRLILTSQTVRAEGAMTLREVSKSDERLEPWGNVLVHAGVFSAGVQLDGSKIKLVLFDLKKWAASKNLVGEAQLTPAPVAP